MTSRSLRPMISSQRDRLILLSPLAVLGILFAAPAFEESPTVCPFALTTGMACPGCGMTRAASMLVRGDFASAMTFHPLVPLVALMGVGAWVWFALRRRGRVQAMSSRLINGTLISLLAGLLIVWGARLLGGTLPPV